MKLPEAFRLIEKDVTGSTNTDALAAASGGAPEFTLVWAHEQTAARGRFDRKWIADRGNLYWSLILRPKTNTPIDGIVFVAGLAIALTAEEMLQRSKKVSIKWPNDALIEGCKFSGTLIEVASDGAVIVGVGINLNIAPPPDAVLYPATSLKEQGATNLSVEDLCSRFSIAFHSWYRTWEQSGLGGAIRDAYLERMWRLGDPLRVSLNKDKTTWAEGRNLGINESGHLLLETDAGVTKTILTGDVLF